MKNKICERCLEEYVEEEIYPSKYFNLLFCIPCEKEYERKLEDFRIQFMNNQPERSKREDPHLKIEDVENMTKEEMKERMKMMEDTILRQYIHLTSCYVCPKCVGCGALNSMET